MLGKAVADIWLDENGLGFKVLDFIGTPLVALLLAVVVAIFTLGVGTGMDKGELSKSFEASLPPIAGPLLIVAAGGGFKQVLVDTGIGGAIGDAIAGSSISPLLLAWVVAVLIRLATGSATVATITAAGIMAPLASDACPTARPRCSCSPSAAARCSSATSTTPGSGWSRSTSG